MKVTEEMFISDEIFKTIPLRDLKNAIRSKARIKVSKVGYEYLDWNTGNEAFFIMGPSGNVIINDMIGAGDRSNLYNKASKCIERKMCYIFLQYYLDQP